MVIGCHPFLLSSALALIGFRICVWEVGRPGKSGANRAALVSGITEQRVPYHAPS